MPSFYDELVEKLTNPKKQKPYKESSVKPVYRYLTTLHGGSPPTSLDFLLDRPIVMKFLEKYAVNTQRTIVFALRNIAKDFDRDDILEVWKGNIEETEAGKGKPEMNEKSETQQKAYAMLEGDEKGSAWENVLKKVEEFSGSSKDKTIGCLYTMFPPRRNLDYTLMKLSDGYNDDLSKDFNYLVVGLRRVRKEGKKVIMRVVMRFVFNRYKTDGVYHQKIFDVPDDLVEVLKSHIRKEEVKDGEFLLTKQTGGSLRSDDITESLHKVIGSGVSSQMLRHMYLDKYNTPEREEVIREMMGDAEKMAHSISMQQGTYVKK
jgi:hypothetical protein